MSSVTHRIPGLVLTDHEFSLPLDYSRPQGEQITVFGREVVAPGKEKADLPWLLFLQGGPGFGSPRPEGRSGWLARVLQEYRVLLLDQRGTGRSTPVLAQTLAGRGTAQAQADYLKHFRADAIVQDAEAIRRQLVGKDRSWSVLGQSYGGFCAVHYLSAAPQGLKEVLITGGIPPLARPVDEVYRATYRRVARRNQQYYQRYPGDVKLVQEIVAYLLEKDVQLPSGGQLTARRFLQLGISFGMSNGFEQIHYLLEGAFVQGAAGRELSYAFLRGVENAQAFETNPIYVLLHEPIYCEGTAANWSAERVRAEFPEFSIQPGQAACFTGEMVYPWMCQDYAQLRPLQEAADLLAAYADWPALYKREALRANRVPCAAAVYYDDMYVEQAFSEQAAAEIGGIRLWITNEHEHSALRMFGEAVVEHLLGMVRGER